MNERTDFAIHHLRFEVEALTPLVLPARAGPSIRGALWGALQRHFCPASPAPSRPQPAAVSSLPTRQGDTTPRRLPTGAR